ncbi:MAG: hypothetical protein WC686_02340 [Candidatus Shapirobacteria bacterium]|jgi:D-alanyl-D-alanine carboxypeptidase (penicillin-binding protein 5/6)
MSVKSLSFEPFIFAFILILNLFWLPSTGVWQFYPQPSSAATSGSDLLTYQPHTIPKLKSSVSPPVTADYFILVDAQTNTILASRNHRARIYPASITKLATAITALNIYPLDEVVTVYQEYSEGKVLGLKVNEKITVRSLVQALLIYSANDAAFNLASHHRQGIEGFISEMNQIAVKYKLSQTHFTNFDGVHHPDHYSTIYDLSQLGRLSLQNPIVTDVVKQKDMVVSDIDGLFQHPIISTNELLGIKTEIEGLKTGWTPEAGGCFIGLINIDGHYLISVVAQSQDRFQDTAALVDWAKSSVSWSTL